MSHRAVQDKNSSANEFPSRSMSREENFEFDERLNSRYSDFSPSSSVTSSESDISDIPPPPPPALEDDIDCSSSSSDYADESSRCSEISDRNSPPPTSDRKDTVAIICTSLCRISTTVDNNDTKMNDKTHAGCEVNNDERSHPCSQDCTDAQSHTNVSNSNQQTSIACESDDDDGIDKNCDHYNEECEHEDGSNGKIDHITNFGVGFDDINDKFINASIVGFKDEDNGHNFSTLEDDNGTSLIEPVIPQFDDPSISLERIYHADLHHCSNNSSSSPLSVRSIQHEIETTPDSASIDPPATDEDKTDPTRCPHLADHQFDIHHTLRACFLILKVFALRCAFDHWRRKTNYEYLSSELCDDSGMLSLTSNYNSSSSILSPDSISITSLRSFRYRPSSSSFHVSI